MEVSYEMRFRKFCSINRFPKCENSRRGDVMQHLLETLFSGKLIIYPDLNCVGSLVHRKSSETPWSP